MYIKIQLKAGEYPGELCAAVLYESAICELYCIAVLLGFGVVTTVCGGPLSSISSPLVVNASHWHLRWHHLPSWIHVFLIVEWIYAATVSLSTVYMVLTHSRSHWLCTSENSTNKIKQ